MLKPPPAPPKDADEPEPDQPWPNLRERLKDVPRGGDDPAKGGTARRPLPFKPSGVEEALNLLAQERHGGQIDLARGDSVTMPLADLAAEGESLLEVAAGSPLLSVERRTLTYGERPVELRRGLYRTDAHHYRNELQ